MFACLQLIATKCTIRFAEPCANYISYFNWEMQSNLKCKSAKFELLSESNSMLNISHTSKNDKVRMSAAFWVSNWINKLFSLHYRTAYSNYIISNHSLMYLDFYQTWQMYTFSKTNMETPFFRLFWTLIVVS